MSKRDGNSGVEDSAGPHAEQGNTTSTPATRPAPVPVSATNASHCQDSPLTLAGNGTNWAAVTPHSVRDAPEQARTALHSAHKTERSEPPDVNLFPTSAADFSTEPVQTPHEPILRRSRRDGKKTSDYRGSSNDGARDTYQSRVRTSDHFGTKDDRATSSKRARSGSTDGPRNSPESPELRVQSPNLPPSTPRSPSLRPSQPRVDSVMRETAHNPNLPPPESPEADAAEFVPTQLSYLSPSQDVSGRPTARDVVAASADPVDTAAESAETDVGSVQAVTVAPGTVGTPAIPPEDEEFTDNEPRHCWCLQQHRPPDCKMCHPDPSTGVRSSEPCVYHELVQCLRCDRKFHHGCILSIKHLPPTSNRPVFTCHFCEYSVPPPNNGPWRTLVDCEHKNLRYGLPKPRPNYSGVDGEQDLTARRHDMKIAMRRCNGPAVVHPVASDIPNSSSHFHSPDRLPNLVQRQHPRPIPTPVTMDPDVEREHTRIGRRFEVSQLMFPVLKCACCGVVRPFHDDPDFPNSPAQVLPRHHLAVRPKDAYHCTGQCCDGSQFWATGRPVIMAAYRRAHGVSRSPLPNCTVCSECADEVKTKDNGMLGGSQPSSFLPLSPLPLLTAHPLRPRLLRTPLLQLLLSAPLGPQTLQAQRHGPRAQIH